MTGFYGKDRVVAGMWHKRIWHTIIAFKNALKLVRFLLVYVLLVRHKPREI